MSVESLKDSGSSDPKDKKEKKDKKDIRKNTLDTQDGPKKNSDAKDVDMVLNKPLPGPPSTAKHLPEPVPHINATSDKESKLADRAAPTNKHDRARSPAPRSGTPVESHHSSFEVVGLSNRHALHLFPSSLFLCSFTLLVKEEIWRKLKGF